MPLAQLRTVGAEFLDQEGIPKANGGPGRGPGDGRGDGKGEGAQEDEAVCDVAVGSTGRERLLVHRVHNLRAWNMERESATASKGELRLRDLCNAV